MIDMSKETIYTLADRLKQWQKRKPRTENNKNELFACCYELADRTANHFRRIPFDGEERQNFIFFLAEEIYATVITRDDIDQYVAYINTILMRMINEYQELICIAPKAYNNKAYLFYNPERALRYTPFDMESITNTNNTVTLVRTLVNDLNKCMRYTKAFSSSVARLNARVSMNLSIKYGRFVRFRLNDSDASLCRYLYNKFKLAFQKIVSESHTTTLSNDAYLHYISMEIRGELNDE